VVTFTPQESCPWLPFALAGTGQSISGASPEYCPFPLDASLVVNSPVSADSDNKFAVPITGIGLSAIRPSTAELDFGAEEQLHPPEASLPQSLSFTNTSPNPVEILEGAACVGGILPHPVQTRPVAGLQVVANYSGIANFITPDVTTIIYSCDTDPGTFLPNFQISSDTCSGTTLAPQASCSLSIAYVPQPNTDVGDGLDAFVELNTLQCAGGVPSEATPCEIDSGRFPVELKTNGPSPLRMSPGAGLDFGTQSAGKKSAAQTVTLLNDPDLASPQTVTFVGKIQVSGNYSESDDCPAALAPGSSCTLSVIFKPGGVGFSPGTITINYTPEPTGQGQFVYLRGTGQ
jgi:hypothetical protein